MQYMQYMQYMDYMYCKEQLTVQDQWSKLIQLTRQPTAYGHGPRRHALPDAQPEALGGGTTARGR